MLLIWVLITTLDLHRTMGLASRQQLKFCPSMELGCAAVGKRWVSWRKIGRSFNVCFKVFNLISNLLNITYFNWNFRLSNKEIIVLVKINWPSGFSLYSTAVDLLMFTVLLSGVLSKDCTG